MKIEIVGTNISTPGVAPARNGAIGNFDGVPRRYALAYWLCSLIICSYLIWFLELWTFVTFYGLDFPPLDLTGDFGCIYIALWFEIEFILTLARKLNKSCFMVFAISLWLLLVSLLLAIFIL